MKVYYSLCGEGLGHATRALAISEALPYDFTFFTHGRALEFLKAKDKDVTEIKGLKFSYSNGRVNTFKTLTSAASFFLNPKTEIRGQADICISDWEPTLYSFAKSNGIPLIEVASQFKFRFPKKMSANPYTHLISLMTRMYRADHYIVPSFQFENVIESDLVTPTFGFTNLKRVDSKYFIIYTHSRALTNKILNDFAGQYNPNDIIIFDPESNIPPTRFHYYLTQADRVASTAGTQLISECASMGIPINLYPISNQPEQKINCQNAVDLRMAHKGFSMEYCTKKYYGMNGIDKAIEKIKQYES
jgi:uncharacterized protein (TIGR00661 family)